MKNGIGKINFEILKNIFWNLVIGIFGIRKSRNFGENPDFLEIFRKILERHKMIDFSKIKSVIEKSAMLRCMWLSNAYCQLRESLWKRFSLRANSILYCGFPKNLKKAISKLILDLEPRSSDIGEISTFQISKNQFFHFPVFPPPYPTRCLNYYFYTLGTHPQTPELTF